MQSSLRDSASYLGIGSSLAFTVLLCLWLGHWLDKKFGTEPRYMLVGAGGVAAFPFLEDVSGDDGRKK